MFEKLVEIQRHLRNYFPDAYIHLSIAHDSWHDHGETNLILHIRSNGLDINKKFTSYNELVDYVQKLIFAETLLMNKRIEETRVYKQNWN